MVQWFSTVASLQDRRGFRLSVWSFHVLPMSAWVPKVRLIGDSKLLKCVSECLSLNVIRGNLSGTYPALHRISDR